MGWKIGFLVLGAIFVVVSAALSALILGGHSSSAHAATTPPVAATPVGRFIGVITNSAAYGSSYVIYKSIPFAKPPVGPLRFQRPQPLDNTDPNQLANSDAYRKSCWSVTKKSTDPNYSEDCLYLNVYVPGQGTPPTADKLPVMIWIHGGGFVAGTTFPEPEKLVVRGNVIVVTINYRLGVFGFLTTLSEELPGNNGLWDQYMAMKWVKENIQYFGGDDTSITIFGESAGSMSAAFHAISPVSSSTFHKAILQSGAATGLLSRDYNQRAKDFSLKVGCSDYSSPPVLARCLRDLTVEIILKYSTPPVYNISLAQQQVDFIWMPVVDGELIPDEPLKLLNNISYLKAVGAFEKDIIFGLLNNEGGLLTENFLNTIPLSVASKKFFVENLVDYLLYERYGPTDFETNDIKGTIYEFYTGSRVLNPESVAQSILDLAADVIFSVPAIEMAMSLARCHKSNTTACVENLSETPVFNCTKTTSKIYLYHFNYCPATAQCSANCMVHGADVMYQFPRAVFPDPEQQKISDTFVDILTTFARDSDPGTEVKSGWPAFELSSQKYLSVDVSPSVRQYLYNYRVLFWLKQVTHLIQQTKLI